MWRDTVYVGGDVTIAAAATLTLAPNTKVLFLPYRDDVRGGLDTTRAELVVAGRLAAQAGASSLVQRMRLRWGRTGMALSLSRAGEPTYPTLRYETASA